MADVVDLKSWRVAKVAVAQSAPLAATLDDLRAIIEAAGALDLTAKAQIAEAVAGALGGDATVPGYWQIRYVC
jgi:hypothetical protein